jgi:hypothetical protein
MPRRRKTLMPDAPLTPVPAEILDQFVRQGPLSAEELEAAVRRFKKAIIERADAAVPLDAKSASTGTWKTPQHAVSHSAHTHHRFPEGRPKNETYAVNPASHTTFLTLPRAAPPIVANASRAWPASAVASPVSRRYPRPAACRRRSTGPPPASDESPRRSSVDPASGADRCGLRPRTAA